MSDIRIILPLAGSPDPTSSIDSAYRTVIKLGDTQGNVYTGTQGLLDLESIVDWIIANKDAENIDFVMHPGDSIDRGASCPTATPNELWLGGPDTVIEIVDEEWSNLNTQISRLEPSGAWGGVPVLFARGNHDNKGEASDITASLDTTGWLTYRSLSYWQGLETAFSSEDRFFEVEAQSPSALSHVFRVHIGDNLVRVICPTLRDATDNETQWAIERCAEYPTIPAILLTHWWASLEGAPDAELSIIQEMRTVCPQLFSAQQGHVGGATVLSLDTINANAEDVIIRNSADFSGEVSRAWIVRERYYLNDAGEVTDIEADTYNTDTGVTLTTGDDAISKQAFSIASPVPYDLSGFNIAHAINWPNPPTNITTFVTISSGDSTSAFATAVATSNSRITVEAGYTGTGASTWGDDIDIIMADTATITSTCFIGTITRLRWVGGNISSGQINGQGVTDVLFDNVLIDSTSTIAHNAAAGGQKITRMALVNCTLIADQSGGSGWGFVTPEYGSLHEDIIIANCQIESDNYQGSRIQSVNRLTVVDSLSRVSNSNTTNSSWRWHHVNQNVHLENLIAGGFMIASTGAEGEAGLLTTTMNNVHVYTETEDGTVFMSESYTNTGTVTNSVLHAEAGSGSWPGAGSLTDGGGNSRVAWDGTTIDYTVIPGKTTLADIGADH